MNNHNDVNEIPTCSLENKNLEKAISSMTSNPTMKNMDMFINQFLSSSLIVLINDFIHESSAFDADGYFSLSQFDNLPLVKFDDEQGNFVFPVFTNVSYAENSPYFEGFIPLIVPALQVLEMASMMDCDKMVLNFESNEMIELDKILIDSLVFKLISNGELSLQNTFM
jgi:hypothetical protein